jgi:hypothetical protein
MQPNGGSRVLQDETRREEQMTAYQMYFLDHQGSIVDLETVYAGNDREALRMAERHASRSDAAYAGFEIWKGPHRIAEPRAAFGRS